MSGGVSIGRYALSYSVPYYRIGIPRAVAYIAVLKICQQELPDKSLAIFLELSKEIQIEEV